MGRFLKVLLASFILVICVLALVFIFGPYVVGHETVGKYVGAYIQWIVPGASLVLMPWVNRWLR